MFEWSLYYGWKGECGVRVVIMCKGVGTIVEEFCMIFRWPCRGHGLVRRKA